MLVEVECVWCGRKRTVEKRQWFIGRSYFCKRKNPKEMSLCEREWRSKHFRSHGNSGSMIYKNCLFCGKLFKTKRIYTFPRGKYHSKLCAHLDLFKGRLPTLYKNKTKGKRLLKEFGYSYNEINKFKDFMRKVIRMGESEIIDRVSQALIT